MSTMTVATSHNLKLTLPNGREIRGHADSTVGPAGAKLGNWFGCVSGQSGGEFFETEAEAIAWVTAELWKLAEPEKAAA